MSGSKAWFTYGLVWAAAPGSQHYMGPHHLEHLNKSIDMGGQGDIGNEEPQIILAHGPRKAYILPCLWGAGRSSEVDRSLMVRWIVRSILHGVDPLSYFSFQPVLHDWCNIGRGMCYPVCGMVHIKEPLLLIRKSSLCGGSGFPFSLSEWSLTICLMPYNRK